MEVSFNHLIDSLPFVRVILHSGGDNINYYFHISMCPLVIDDKFWKLNFCENDSKLSANDYLDLIKVKWQ